MSEQTSLVKELNHAADSYDMEDVRRILRESRANSIVIPSKVLEDLPDRFPIQANNASITMPYSGLVDLLGDPMKKDTLKAYQLANGLADGASGQVAIIDKTQVSDLLMSEDFRRMYKFSLDSERLSDPSIPSFDQKYNGMNENFTRRISNESLWDRQSARFMVENPLPQVGITAFAKPTSIYGNTEYPTIMNEATTPTLEGVSKGDYAAIKEAGGSLHDMRSTTSLLSAHNIGAIEYGYDAEGKLHLDTHAFWGDVYPEIPRTDIPDTVTERKLVGDVMMGMTPYEAKTLNRGISGLDTIASASPDLDDVAQDVKRSKLFKQIVDLGEKGVVTALVASGLNVMLTQSAIAGQRDMAAMARDLPPDDPRHITQDQYDGYIKIMDELEPRMLSEAADPFFATSTAQAVANEAASYELYNEFIAQNHTLDPQLAEGLRPGLIKIDTTMEILRDRTIEVLRDDPANLPPSMQDLAASVREVEAANLEFQNAMARNTPPAFSVLEDTELMALNQPEVQQAMVRLDGAIHNMHSEFIDTLQSPDGAHFIMSQLSDQELLQVVERTARFDEALDNGSELRAYSAHSASEKALLERVDCIGSSPEETMECSMFIARKEQLAQALLDDPEAMSDYLENKFVPEANRPASVHDMSTEQIARIEGSEDYIKMAIPLANMQAGIDNLPAQRDELILTVKHADFYTDNQDLKNARDLAAVRFPSEMGEVQADIQNELDAITKQLEYEAQQREMHQQAFEQWQQQGGSAPAANDPLHKVAAGL